MKRLTTSVLFMFFMILNSISQSPVVKVDFDMTGRQEAEVNEPGYTPWTDIAGTSISRTIDGVTFGFTYSGSGTALSTNYYKTAVQAPYYARLVGDGLTVDEVTAATEIRLTISGLSAGAHSLVTYHNNVDNPATNTFCPVDIYVNGSLIINNLVPSVRALSNDAGVTSYLTFNVTSGQDVVIRYVSDPSSSASNKNIIINGFELNVPNPDYQATFPSPTDQDEHINADNGNVTLSWTGASSAVSHDVYISTDLSELQNASHSSPAFKGNQTNTSYNLTGIYSMDTYYWRVDEITSGGVVTKGSTWYFRPRIVAFPGAEGYGRYARGGRNGVVVHVTNLNDSGAGSLREAVESDIGPRTIVFDVAGIITLNSRLVLGSKYVTVAGQTAPGKGICIRSAPFGMSGAQDAIIQNVRLRLGYGTTYDGMGMQGSEHCIIDHCSISWAIDEVFSSRSAKNITLQRTMLAEALNIADHANYPSGTMHGYAASIGGDIGSFHHNLLAHNYGRNWSLAGGLDGSGSYAGRLDIFNNVVYNWGGRATDGGAHEVNFVNNYYKKGSGTTQNTILNAQIEGTGLGTQSYYYAGNIVENTNGSLACDGTNNSCARTYTLSNGQILDWTVFVSSPFFSSGATVQSAKDAYKNTLSDIGCTQPAFDNHDLRIVTETRNGTYTYSGSISGIPGMPDRESDVGGFESYPATTHEAGWDTDNDGLPDWWETYFVLNPNSSPNDFSDANNDSDGDGYTQMDKYLQWMTELHYIISSGQTVSVNLGQMFFGYTASPSYSALNVTNGSVTIQSGTATFTPTTCGMASFDLKVTDNEGSTMTKKIGVFISGTCTENQYSLTTSVTGQGTVSPGSGNFTEGTSVTLTATPVSGWVFSGWSGSISGTTNPVTVTMDGDKNITAQFFQAITIEENQTGFCSVDGTVDSNNSGYTGDGFANTDNAAGNGIDWKVAFTSSGTKTFIFRYAATSDRPADLIVNGSTVASGINFPSTGSWTTWNTVSVTASVSTGTYDVRLEATGSSGLANIDNIAITNANAASCSATPVYYTLSTTVSGSGSVSPSSGSFESGTSVALTAIPASGWYFDSWSGAISSTANPASVTMDANKNVVAQFLEVSTTLPFEVASGLFNESLPDNLGLNTASGTETVRIFDPTSSTDRFSNGAVMTGFNGFMYCQWQSSAQDEDSQDTWVAYSRSADGINWTAPMALAASPSDGHYSSGGWWVNGNTLVAYINYWPSSLAVRGGYTLYTTSNDGINWSSLQSVLMADGSAMNAIFEQDPHALPDGRIINAAHFQTGLIVSPIYTDDPSGTTGWVKANFTNLSYSGDVSREIEPSWFLRDDNAVVMIFRDQNSTYKCLASISYDRGQNWTTAVVTDMPDSRSKKSAGNLPDGTAFMVGNPVTTNTRIPLAITLSQDGQMFDQAYALRQGGSDLQPQEFTGVAKTLGYNYPKSMVWQDYLYVSYATNKEDVEFTRIPLTSLYQNPFLLVSENSLSVNAAANSTVSFNITSNVSWTVTSNQSWISANLTSGTNSSAIILTANANTSTLARTATVTVSGTGVSSQSILVTQSGIITYNLTATVTGQGSVSPTSGTFNAGSVVTLTATPASGWQFESWSGDISNSSNPVTITMNSDMSVSALFTETTTAVTIAIQENQTGFCGVDGSIDNNNAGFTGDGFANTDNATGSGIDYKVSFQSAGDYSFTFRYASGSDRPAALLINGSTVISNIDFPATANWTTWTTVSTTATVNAGTYDVRLEATGSGGLGNIDYMEVTGSDPSAANCIATPVTYTLTTSTSGQGSINPTGGDFNEGTQATITATPASGWQFNGWSGDASGTNNPLSITMDANKNITAEFTEIVNIISLTLQENQTGFCSVDGSVDNNNTGFTGDGFANTANSAGSGITWSVNIPASGTYNLLWRYANGGSTDRTGQLMVDGSVIVSNISMPSTGSWTTWAETSATSVNLSAGTKLVRVQATNASGLSNIDYIELTGVNPVAVACTGLKSADELTASNLVTDVVLYPIPAKDKLVIKFNREPRENTYIILLDITGKQLMKKNAEGIVNTLDVSGFANGLYLVNISEGEININKTVIKE